MRYDKGTFVIVYELDHAAKEQEEVCRGKVMHVNEEEMYYLIGSAEYAGRYYEDDSDYSIELNTEV